MTKKHRFALVQKFSDYVNGTDKPVQNPQHNIVFHQTDENDIILKDLTLLRPAYQKNLMDPETGEAQMNPDTGEALSVIVTDETLIENINLRIKPGDRIVVTGTNGCGKSTLLRTIGGFWPSGFGDVYIPMDRTLLSLPQATFVPRMGLKDIMSYPYPATHYPDDAYRDALIAVGHERLLPLLAENEKQKAFEDKLFAAAQTLALDYKHGTRGQPEAMLDVFRKRLDRAIDDKFGESLSSSRLQVLKDTILSHMGVTFASEQAPENKEGVAASSFHRLQMFLRARALAKALYKDVENIIPPMRPEPAGVALERSLSGGEKQRLRIAGILVQKPDILIMDESTSALDEKTSIDMYNLLLNRLKPATTIVSIVHNEKLIDVHDKHIMVKDKHLTVLDIEKPGKHPTPQTLEL